MAERVFVCDLAERRVYSDHNGKRWRTAKQRKNGVRVKVQLYMEKMKCKEHEGVRYDAQPVVLFHYEGGAEPLERYPSVFANPSGRGLRTDLAFWAENRRFYLHRVVAFAWGNPQRVSWQDYDTLYYSRPKRRKYEADHKNSTDDCRIDCVQVVVGEENARLDRVRRDIRAGPYSQRGAFGGRPKAPK